MALPSVGNGSEQNPYQITTADEFMTVVETKDCFGILMNDIDFNNSNFYHITDYICWRAKSIDGRGHLVTNLLMKDISNHNIWFRLKDKSGGDDRSSTESTVKNIILEMVFITTDSGGDHFFITNYYNAYYESNGTLVNFENVDFRITYYMAYSNSLELLFKATRSMNFTYCVFNIYYVITRGANVSVFQDNIDLNSCQADITFQQTTTSNFRIYKDLHAIYNVATFVHFNDTSAYTIYVYDSNTNNSYVVADSLIANPDPTNPCHTLSVCSGGASSVVFYDTNTINPTTSTPDEYKINIINGNTETNVYGLTTTQCKNATYLNSLGFIIAI